MCFIVACAQIEVNLVERMMRKQRVVTCITVEVTALMFTAPPTHGRNVLVVEEAQAATTRHLRDIFLL